MKLCYSATSPFVRKVSMVAIETGQQDKIENVPYAAVGPATDVAKVNPLGKVPALIADDGTCYFDSPVVCEYLDTLHSGPRMIPVDGPERIKALQQQALADGVMDAGIAVIMEDRRTDGEKSLGWVERQKTAMNQGLDVMDQDVDSLNADADIGNISFCACLGWIDLRDPIGDWRASRPALADWYAAYSARPAAMATEPKP